VGALMDKSMNMTQNVFSKKYNYISIDKEQDKILTHIYLLNKKKVLMVKTNPNNKNNKRKI
jgi:hypothetical protein